MKRFFNLVEVILAMGITAIGIAGLMGIIPIAMRANNDAMAEYFVADIAESEFANIEAYIKNSGFTTAMAGVSDSIPSAPDAWNPLDLSVTISDGVNIFSGTTQQGKDGKTRATGVYHVIVGKSGLGYNDFTGDIRVWKESVPFTQIISSPAEISNGPVKRVYLEVSWPALTAHAERNVRVFVRDFTDPSVNLIVE